MIDAHLHLALSHLPVVGGLVAVTLLAAALFLRQTTVRRLAMVATVLAALSGIPAFVTGGRAEEVVEGAPGIEETRVERHEDLALIALIGLELAGAIALTGLLVFRRGAIPKSLLLVVLVVDLGAAVLLSRVATPGGGISHPEIRASVLVPIAPSSTA